MVSPKQAIFQPPHSPELNPIERFWGFLKSQLQWENCKTLSQLQQKLTDALKEITPSMIASLTSYDFILEALFKAASFCDRQQQRHDNRRCTNND
ncbi:hypothetical protein BZZ01_09180 [Nostocales cyanobacterium HT-58-2]|nr:hypothetical protein BZZ01_09180 [Nostocales cyanobacterium HT-58-2]